MLKSRTCRTSGADLFHSVVRALAFGVHAHERAISTASDFAAFVART
jgi:hypothetical protein